MGSEQSIPEQINCTLTRIKKMKQNTKMENKQKQNKQKKIKNKKKKTKKRN